MGEAMNEEAGAELPYQDLPSLAEVYADQLRLTHFDGYSVRLEFAVMRPRLTAPNQSEPVVHPAVRLVLPPHALFGLRDQLDQLLRVLEQQGVVRRVMPAAPSRQ
jgi:hypothetical protein